MDNLKVILKEETIKEKIKELAKDLSKEYKNDNPVVIGIMRGAIYFLTDLTKEMDIKLEIDLMGLSSYGNSDKTSGKVKITKDLEVDITGRRVIVVEDIVDSGTTLNYLKNYFLNQEAKSVETISLFIKEKSLKLATLPDRYLIEVPDEFLVGYGLDYANQYRDLKDLCVLEINK